MICQECEDAKAANEDPRSPPLDIGDEVLCFDCFCIAAEEVIDEHKDEVNRLLGLIADKPE